MTDSEMEEYDFECSEDDMEEQDVDIENQYYNSKGLLETDEGLEEALEGLRQVLGMEVDDRERWRFKALKQIARAHLRLGQSAAALRAYRDLLAASAAPSISRAAAEKKVNSTLDMLAASADRALLREAYATTLEALEARPNPRLYLKTQLKLAQLLLSERRLDDAQRVLDDAHRRCACEDEGLQRGDAGGNKGEGAMTTATTTLAPPATTSTDHRAGGQLLEIIALLIQVHTERGSTGELKGLYQRARAVRTAIPHPRILGVVHECGGRVHAAAGDWEAAATDFYEAFKSHDEAGSGARLRCLRYLVLATLLLGGRVDPFDSQEARPYKKDPELAPMLALATAFQAGDVGAFEAVLRTHRAELLDADPLVREHTPRLLRTLRTAVVTRFVRPYRRVTLRAVAEALHLPGGAEAARPLLVAMILDGALKGSIDHMDNVLVLERTGDDEAAAQQRALRDWAGQLSQIQAGLQSRLLAQGASAASLSLA